MERAKIKLETHTSSPINHVTIKIDQLNMADIQNRKQSQELSQLKVDGVSSPLNKVRTLIS